MDLISRRAALEKVRTMQTYKLFEGDDMILVDQADVQTELMALPPAQPMRKKGRWIYTGGMEEWWAKEFKCSECGESMLGTANFCPNCGARMVTE